MTTERFEFRVDSEWLERLDLWREEQEDSPSRAQAIRLLVERALEAGAQQRGVQPFSDGEKAISLMLIDLLKHHKVKGELDASLIEDAVIDGHYWALNWKMPGLYHGVVHSEEDARFVSQVLEMWEDIEDSVDSLSVADRAHLMSQLGRKGPIRFPGFDGNHEGKYFSIACFLVEKMGHFQKYAKNPRSLNSHFPAADRYERMLAVLEPMRGKIPGGQMNLAQLCLILAVS